MKKLLLILTAALLSATGMQAMTAAHESFEKAHPRGEHGQFVKREAAKRRLARRAYHRGGRHHLPLSERIARNALKASDLKVIVQALHQVSAPADVISRAETKLARTEGYGAKLHRMKTGGVARGGKAAGWLSALGLGGKTAEEAKIEKEIKKEKKGTTKKRGSRVARATRTARA